MDKGLMEELGLMVTDSQLDYIDTLLDQAASWKTTRIHR